MKTDIGVEMFIDVVDKAGARVRATLLLIVICTVVVFSALWNSMDYGDFRSWTKSEIEVVQAAIKYSAWWDDPNERNARTLAVPGKPTEVDAFNRAIRYCQLQKIALGPAPSSADPGVKAARDGLAEANHKRLLAQIEVFGKQIREAHRIHVPFFGVEFSDNDLGLLGGFAMAVALAMYYYALRREKENLVIAFDHGLSIPDTETRRAFYRLLVATQVLSMPPLLAAKPTVMERFGAGVTRATPGWLRWMFCAPVILQAIVLTLNYKTVEVGRLLSEGATSVSLWGARAFLVICILITISCLFLRFQIDRVWTHGWNSFKAKDASLGIPQAGDNASDQAPSGVSPEA